MPVLARTLLALKGNRLPEVTDDLVQMMKVDGINLLASLKNPGQ